MKIALKKLRLAWFGSCAMGCREPCQVRKEAAISRTFYVKVTFHGKVRFNIKGGRQKWHIQHYIENLDQKHLVR